MFRKDFTFAKPLEFDRCYRCGSQGPLYTVKLQVVSPSAGEREVLESPASLQVPNCESCWQFRWITWVYDAFVFVSAFVLTALLLFPLVLGFDAPVSVSLAILTALALSAWSHGYLRTRYLGIRVRHLKRSSHFKYFISNRVLNQFNDEFWEPIYWCDTKAIDVLGPLIPGKFRLSRERLRVLQPDFFGWRGCLWKSFYKLLWRNSPQVQLEEHLIYGDCRAAAVVEISPLLVAAYSGELDCVVLLRFPDHFVGDYQLAVGKKLLTSNCYHDAVDFSGDWTQGPKKKPNRWTLFHPVIVDFLTDDKERLAYCKSLVEKDEWKRAFKMGLEYKSKHPGVARHGYPFRSDESAIEPMPEQTSKWDKYANPMSRR